VREPNKKYRLSITMQEGMAADAIHPASE
jgi:hypothetical protein